MAQLVEQSALPRAFFVLGVERSVLMVGDDGRATTRQRVRQRMRQADRLRQQQRQRRDERGAAAASEVQRQHQGAGVASVTR